MNPNIDNREDPTALKATFSHTWGIEPRTTTLRSCGFFQVGTDGLRLLSFLFANNIQFLRNIGSGSETLLVGFHLARNTHDTLGG